MKRREFLKGSAALAAVAGARPALGAGAPQGGAKIQKYGPLGKTGLVMSDIALGCGSLQGPSMVLRAIDRGITYLDTAPDYGRSEDYIGEAMPRIKRDKIILASKFCDPGSPKRHLPAGATAKDFVRVVERSLSRLRTDYLDIALVHSVGSLSEDFEEEKKRLLNESMFEAAERLKKDGKIRFLGASSHGPNNMDALMLEAVTSGRFDMIMPAFNFMQAGNLPRVLEAAKPAVRDYVKKKRTSLGNDAILREARKRGVGVVAMKTLAGARDLSFEEGGVPFQPAAFKWVLDHPGISGLVVTIKTVAQLDLYLSASGTRMGAADHEVLKRYARAFGRSYCRTGCSDCERSCPRGVAAATVLRYKMYFEDYGEEKRAMTSYAALGRNATACADCDDEGCDGACPSGLPIRDLLREAHEKLRFTA